VRGEDIGTTITANNAGLVGNVHAKRSARFHSLFNVLGVVWMLLLFPYFLDMVDWLNQLLLHENSVFEITETAAERSLLVSTLTDGLALFHTTFNVLNTILLIGFAPAMVKLVVRFTKAKSREEEGFRLQYISRGLMSTPELSVQEAMKEVQQFGRLVEKMCANVMVLLFKTPRNKEKLLNKIGSREEITDRLQNEITRYMARLGEYRLSEHSASRVKSMIRMASDMERMGDIFYMLSLNKRRMDDQRKKMPESIKKELEAYFDIIYKSIKKMNESIQTAPEEINMEQVYESEHEINTFRDNLKKAIYDRIENGQYPVEDGILYLDFVSAAEKLGDHIVNVNQALAGIK
jgi:phosphate:Na+ symporter